MSVGQAFRVSLSTFALVAGMLVAAFAGQFFLGAYAQRFEVLNEFRLQGSDGYPFTWAGALFLAGVGTLLVAAAGLALPGRVRSAYLGAAIGLIFLTIPGPLAQLWGLPGWIAGLAPPVLGLLVVWLATRSRSVAVVFPALALAFGAGTVAVATIREEEPRPCHSCPVVIASAESPGPLLPPMEYARFVAELRAGGATVVEEPLDTAQPFFSIRGRVMLVEGERVIVFEYGSVADAEADARTVSPDGRRDERSIVDWVAPPHFYRRGPLVVQYIGASPTITDLLTRLLGPQFAGQ